MISIIFGGISLVIFWIRVVLLVLYLGVLGSGFVQVCLWVLCSSSFLISPVCFQVSRIIWACSASLSIPGVGSSV